MATEKQKRFAKLIANGCDENNDPVTATDAYTLAGYKELFLVTPRESRLAGYWQVKPSVN